MRATMAAAIAAALTIAGCGATKTITRTVTTTRTETVTVALKPQYPAASVEDLIGVKHWAHTPPATMTFAVDGSLYVKGLQWSGWGEPIASAEGTISWRDWPSQNYSSAFGLLALRELVTCKFRRYYTIGALYAPGMPKIDEQSFPLETPCSNG